MRLTLNGSLGSGKSSVGKLLSSRHSVPYISTGMIFREIGKISNLNALQTNLAAENNSEIDFQVDKKIVELDTSLPEFIIDSRMAWHFVHNAINVFLSVTIDTAAERVMHDLTRTGEHYSTLGDAKRALVERRASESKRYQRLYGVDIDSNSNYDLVLITDNTSVESVATSIEKYMVDRRHKYWIPKSRIVPMESIRSASGLRFATRFSTEEMNPIPLIVAENFGFYFGAASALINALHADGDLIPYQIQRPEHLADDQDPFSLAMSTLRPSDLYDWEDCAHHRFAIVEHLAARKTTNNTN